MTASTPRCPLIRGGSRQQSATKSKQPARSLPLEHTVEAETRFMSGAFDNPPKVLIGNMAYRFHSVILVSEVVTILADIAEMVG